MTTISAADQLRRIVAGDHAGADSAVVYGIAVDLLTERDQLAEKLAAASHRAERAEAVLEANDARANDAEDRLAQIRLLLPTLRVMAGEHAIALVIRALGAHATQDGPQSPQERPQAPSATDASSHASSTPQRGAGDVEARAALHAAVRNHWDDPTMPWPIERLREFNQLADKMPDGQWQAVLARVADIRSATAAIDRLNTEIAELQVELGAALDPDDDPEPLTLRDIDPDAVYATEDDDFDDERAEAHSEEAPF